MQAISQQLGLEKKPEEDDKPQEEEQKEMEVDMICPCTVGRCTRRCKKDPIIWKHNECDGKLKLNENGYMRCVKCGKKEQLWNCMFDCGSKSVEFKKIEGFYGIAHLLSLVSSIKCEKVNEFSAKLN